MSDQFNFYSNIHQGQEMMVEAEARKYFYLQYQSKLKENEKSTDYFNQQAGDSWEV